MNYIKHLTGFFEKVTLDKQLNPTHISLYIALFQFWNCNRFRNPISISRDEVMRISKISSKATYHKCLKALHANGYLKYEPSYNPFRGSHVYLFHFADDLKPWPKSGRAGPNTEPANELPQGQSQSGTQTSTVPVDRLAVVPSLNNTNLTNNSNIENAINASEPAKIIKGENSVCLKNDTLEKEKSSAEKEKERNGHGLPSLEAVIGFFRDQVYPEVEANKFFNYFQSIGWLVGGKTPMADWQAAARNWMLNVPKYLTNERTDRTVRLDTATTKDYAEPL